MPTTAWAWIVTSQLQITLTQQVEGPKGVESISHGVMIMNSETL
jgi:hypothetical protein